MEQSDFWTIAEQTQKYIARNYAAALADESKQPELKAYIEKYLADRQLSVQGLTPRELVDRICSEMAEYSVLTPYLGSPLLDEININSWDDIVLTYSDGKIEKLQEHFRDPGHATDIIKRLLHHSGMIIDSTVPIAQGHLPDNTRITAVKTPIVDNDCGIAASIRLLHPQRITRCSLIESGMATEEMLIFLEMCIRYGISVVIAGRTSSGKTSLMNVLLGSIPDEKRIFTIESGARELFLIKRDDSGKIRNNVVHTLSRPSENPAYHVTQEDLVVVALRFNPDLIAIGEIRDAEASAGVEASLTGHTVITTVHSGPAAAAHSRIALLCQRRFPLGMAVSLVQARQAFPVVVFMNRCEDHVRRIMDITEVSVTPEGGAAYRALYRYHITENRRVGGKFQVEGFFKKVGAPSENLQTLMIRSGMSQSALAAFL